MAAQGNLSRSREFHPSGALAVGLVAAQFLWRVALMAKQRPAVGLAWLDLGVTSLSILTLCVTILIG